MRVLETALSAAAIQVKDHVAQLCNEYLAEHYQQISGLTVRGARVTHSWAPLKRYSDPRRSYTVIVPVKTGMIQLRHRTTREFWQQTKVVFKDIGEPTVFWQSKGLLIAVGFNTDLKRITHMTDLI